MHAEKRNEPAHEPEGRAGFPVCRFTGLSQVHRTFQSGAAETGDWKVARTRRLESLRYVLASKCVQSSLEHYKDLEGGTGVL